LSVGFFSSNFDDLHDFPHYAQRVISLVLCTFIG
jgi:hypothetical protein